jgi:hypothetical protein
MNENTTLILDIWDRIKDYIPNSKKEDAAIQLLSTFIDNDYDLKLNELKDNDDYLDSAIDILNEEEDFD